MVLFIAGNLQTLGSFCRFYTEKYHSQQDNFTDKIFKFLVWATFYLFGLFSIKLTIYKDKRA